MSFRGVDGESSEVNSLGSTAFQKLDLHPSSGMP